PTEQTARQQRDDALAQRILNQGLPAFVDFWENIPLFASQKQLPPSTQDHHRQLRLQNNPLGLANSLRGMGTGQQPNLWPHLPTLNLPTHLIAGALDTKFVNLNQQMHAQLPQSTLTIIPQVGHTTHLEAPHQYTNHIHALLLPPT
ncbi:MAG TPA: 2-succinyl-6-hydroxy-2,4-cyclohexadiene-1-carboxylate synthase, partial [Anaerolineae bacterium]|nr:2-succinyl-6-hydroxy-2,4-cyclohexadiene-1-carboxylate synthase [Anaerolineae bacterium]